MDLRGLMGNIRVILALDEEEPGAYWRILGELNGLARAVKLSWLSILTLGPEGVRELLSKFRDIYFIMDAKLADVGFMNERIARKLEEWGFRGVIIHGFVKPINMPRTGMDKYILVSMTQETHYDNLLDTVLAEVSGVERSGLVVPGNRLGVLSRVRSLFPRDIIISPGIGVQGGSAGCATKYGADFVIVGRAIYGSREPRGEFLRINEEALSMRCGV